MPEIDEDTRAAIIAEHEATKAASAVVGELPDPYGSRLRDLVADGADALAAAQAAARGQAISFTHGGETFRFRPVVDVRVVVALNRGNVGRALELALEDGVAGVDRLLATDEPMTEATLADHIGRWAAAIGADPGE